MPLEIRAEQVEWITGQVREYILVQRGRYAGRCKPLEKSQMQAMRGFFPDEALNDTRICVLQGERIANPAFYKDLKRMGITNVLDFGDMAAITLVDIIVSHVPFDHQLLFHELVHIMQYRALGVTEFANRYVQGFLAGGSYERIPLEMQAYEFDGRFAHAPKEIFSVEKKVEAWLQRGML